MAITMLITSNQVVAIAGVLPDIVVISVFLLLPHTDPMLTSSPKPHT
jgi:hypothetical protein